MARIQAFIDSESLEKIKAMSLETGKSSSKIVAKLIVSGLKIEEEKAIIERKKDNLNRLESKKMEYILRLIGLTNSVLECVFEPGKTHLGAKNAQEEMRLIKAQVASLINDSD